MTLFAITYGFVERYGLFGPCRRPELYYLESLEVEIIIIRRSFASPPGRK